MVYDSKHAYVSIFCNFFKKIGLSLLWNCTFDRIPVYTSCSRQKKIRRQLSSLLSFASIVLLTLSRALCSPALSLCHLKRIAGENVRRYSAWAFSRFLDLSGASNIPSPDPRDSLRICLKTTYLPYIHVGVHFSSYGNSSGNDATSAH